MGRQLDDGDDNLLDRGRRTVGQELGDMVAVPLVVLLWGGNSLSPDLMNQYIAISLVCYIFITQILYTYRLQLCTLTILYSCLLCNRTHRCIGSRLLVILLARKSESIIG